MKLAGWGLVLTCGALIALAVPGDAFAQEGLPTCPPVTVGALGFADGAATGEPNEPSPATTPAPGPSSDCRPFVYEIVYPVAGWSIPVDNFGAVRDGHRHGGNDIAAETMTPVVAVASGRISWIDEECCSLAIRHKDNWTSWYIHLNNDTFGTDDGLGWGIAPGLEINTPVRRGDLIGWVGDSGNAEDSKPHLHFEIRTPADISVDPAPSLSAALRLPSSAAYRVPFADDDENSFGNAISTLTSIGLLGSCEESPTSACPDDPATGSQVAELITAITDLDVTDVRPARIPDGPLHDALVNTLGIHRTLPDLSACVLPRFCTEEPITFEALETMMRVRPVLAVPNDTLMTVDDFAAAMLNQFEGDEPLAECSERPSGPMTRGQLAEMVARALGLVGPPPCDQLN
jgi:hypothetical protein